MEYYYKICFEREPYVVNTTDGAIILDEAFDPSTLVAKCRVRNEIAIACFYDMEFLLNSFFHIRAQFCKSHIYPEKYL
jgi:hypothetical protein